MRKPTNILDEWNGYPEIFSFSQSLEFSRQYLLLRTVILQKKVAGWPGQPSIKIGRNNVLLSPYLKNGFIQEETRYGEENAKNCT